MWESGPPGQSVIYADWAGGVAPSVADWWHAYKYTFTAQGGADFILHILWNAIHWWMSQSKQFWLILCMNPLWAGSRERVLWIETVGQLGRWITNGGEPVKILVLEASYHYCVVPQVRLNWCGDQWLAKPSCLWSYWLNTLERMVELNWFWEHQ